MSPTSTQGEWISGVGQVVGYGEALAVGINTEPNWKPICVVSPADRITDTDLANAALLAAAPKLLKALQALLARDILNTCQHDSTHRGGVIWEICEGCGAKWSDDRGGKPKWKDPVEGVLAEEAITQATKGVT